MKTKRSNRAAWGSFQPRGLEQVDAFGDFYFRDINLSTSSIDELEELASIGRTYLDRNAARVELAERRLSEWQGGNW
jgi:hypothetical protein